MPQELKSARPDDAAVLTEDGELDSQSMNAIRNLLGGGSEPAPETSHVPRAAAPLRDAVAAQPPQMGAPFPLEDLADEAPRVPPAQVTRFEVAVPEVDDAPRAAGPQHAYGAPEDAQFEDAVTDTPKAAELAGPVDDAAAFAAALKAAEMSAAQVPFGAEPVKKPQAQGSVPAGAGQKRAGRMPFGFRPKPRHYVYAALAALAIFRPGLIVGALLMALALFLAVFIVLGYDGFWRRAMGLGQWYARLRPAHAEVLLGRMEQFAVKWDAFLDRFPEGTVDGLYLPDFGELATADKRHDEAMSRRLSGIQEGEA